MQKDGKNVTTNVTSNSNQSWHSFIPPQMYQQYLIFDTETLTDATQALRFGVFQLRGIDRYKMQRLSRTGTLSLSTADPLRLSGLFYDPDNISIEEIETLQIYCYANNLQLYSAEKFIHLLYAMSHNTKYHTAVIGHNLAFDLSRFTKELQYPRGDFDGGFSLKLCSCTWENKAGRVRYEGDSCLTHPNIKIKKISPKAHLYEFADRKPRGNFIDTSTLARALLGPGSTSLEALANTLQCDHKKSASSEHGATLTSQYLDYACNDVQVTWEIFVKLREMYTRYNFTQPIHYIFSEASLGKSLYKTLGITSPLSRMQDIPPEIQGYAMTSYYGGKCEVRIRKQETEIAYCDFKSQYPSVYALMDLQEMLLAETFHMVRTTQWVTDMLDNFQLSDLQDKSFWPKIRILCKISGTNLILPVRARYNDKTSNIALARTNLEKPVWYTLADVLANILLGGSIPFVHEALECVPSGRIETNSVSMFDGLIELNPATDNMFVKFIDERTRLKHEAEEEKSDYKDRAQQALKLLANATSYGINIELITKKTDEPITLYGNDGPVDTASNTTQIPGQFYAPLIGTHIPAGGRLLLAICEHLGACHGLTYAMCDTDSIAFAKPPVMLRSTFYKHTADIISWFTPLYPYQEQGELLELEKYNFWNYPDSGKERVPLYFYGISSKRYVLYNRYASDDYDIRLRKVSSHGLGAYRISESYKSPTWIPAPDVSWKELGLNPANRWIYDIWYNEIQKYTQFKDASEYVIPKWDEPDLSCIAYQQLTVSTAVLHKRVSGIKGVKPFNFITVFFRTGKDPVLYVPFTRDVEDIKLFYSLQDGKAVSDTSPTSMQVCLSGYFCHPEMKFEHPSGRGAMERRKITLTGYRLRGKESSFEILEYGAALENHDMQADYLTTQDWQEIQTKMYATGLRELEKCTGINNRRLSEIARRPIPPGTGVLRIILASLP